MTGKEALGNMTKYMELKPSARDKAVLVANSIYKLKKIIEEEKK
jgi:hypothetical protein